MWRWFRRVTFIGIAALIGYGVGSIGGAIGYIIPNPEKVPFLAERSPLPHHVPEYPGGVSVRFAMAHDVIHERFARHGLTYYTERNRLTRKKLATIALDDPARFALLDDLGTGLERLGQSAQAVTVLREKLEAQRQKGLAGRDLYTSYANLGTFLIHGSYKQAVAGDQAARAQLEEGIGFIHKSVEVNPEAHFGRERWQAAIAEFLLAAIDDPSVLTTFDCLGNRLDLGIEAILNREENWTQTGYGRPTDAAFSQGKVQYDFAEPLKPEVMNAIRTHITKVGVEDGWRAVPVPSHRTPVPFDEPSLGIIGMWRQGGGANPHFALALGEIMLRVGQRYIAWDAYERAARLADRFSADPATQQFLRDHCQKRQREIEETLSFQPTAPSRSTPWQTVSPPQPNVTSGQLRRKFEAELAYGQNFQLLYQKFEASKIANGDSIFDDHFYEAFTPGRKPIASPSGSEEWFAGVPRASMYRFTEQRQRAWGVFGAGLAAMITALFLNRRTTRSVNPAL